MPEDWKTAVEAKLNEYDAFLEKCVRFQGFIGWFDFKSFGLVF